MTGECSRCGELLAGECLCPGDLYQVQANVTETRGEWVTTRQIPTFYLDGRLLGIVSMEHAHQVAAAMFADIVGAEMTGTRYDWSFQIDMEGEGAL